ncbi:hypothetical protein IAT38_007450 [Cryptococcus sp. DSM 104549]
MPFGLVGSVSTMAEAREKLAAATSVIHPGGRADRAARDTLSNEILSLPNPPTTESIPLTRRDVTRMASHGGPELKEAARMFIEGYFDNNYEEMREEDWRQEPWRTQGIATTDQYLNELDPLSYYTQEAASLAKSFDDLKHSYKDPRRTEEELTEQLGALESQVEPVKTQTMASVSSASVWSHDFAWNPSYGSNPGEPDPGAGSA